MLESKIFLWHCVAGNLNDGSGTKSSLSMWDLSKSLVLTSVGDLRIVYETVPISTCERLT